MKFLTLCILLLVGVTTQGASNGALTESRSALDRSKPSLTSVGSETETTKTTQISNDNALETDVDGLIVDHTKPSPTIVRRRRNEKLFVVEASNTKTQTTKLTDQDDLQDLPKTRAVLEINDNDSTINTLRDTKQGIRELFWNLQSTNSTQTCMSHEMLDQFHQVLQKLVDMTPSTSSGIGSKTLDELEKMTDFFEKAKATEFSMSMTGGGGSSANGRLLAHV